MRAVSLLTAASIAALGGCALVFGLDEVVDDGPPARTDGSVVVSEGGSLPLPDGGSVPPCDKPPFPVDAKLMETEVVMVIDLSEVMNQSLSFVGSLRSDLVEALDTLFSEPESASLYTTPVSFPTFNDAGCQRNDYAGSAGDPKKVSAGGGNDVMAVFGRPSGGASAFFGAVQASADVAMQEAAKHPERRVVIALISAKGPDTCGKSADALGAVFKQALTTKGVPTYAVALALEAEAVKLHDPIAVAGGTGPKAIRTFAPGGGPPSFAGFIEGLRQLRDRVACDVKVVGDVPMDATRDVVKLDLVGNVRELTPARDRLACPSHGEGWFPAGGNIIGLCPATCRTVLSNARANVLVAQSACR
jgi:hypothetical protein